MQKINQHLTLLDLPMEFMGVDSIIHPLLITDRNYRMLVDTGLPGQYKELSDELEAAGTTPELLDAILLTHQDLDHIGCLPELDQVNQYATIYAHEKDTAYIRGERPLLKTNVVPWQSDLEKLPSGRVDRNIEHGHIFNIAGGIEVIHTPGHTAGHICLLLHEEKAIIAGDIVFYINGQLQLPPAELTEDMETAMQSLEQLLAYDFDTLICYHGAVCTDARSKLKQLLSRSL